MTHPSIYPCIQHTCVCVCVCVCVCMCVFVCMCVYFENEHGPVFDYQKYKRFFLSVFIERYIHVQTCSCIFKRQCARSHAQTYSEQI